MANKQTHDQKFHRKYTLDGSTGVLGDQNSVNNGYNVYGETTLRVVPKSVGPTNVIDIQAKLESDADFTVIGTVTGTTADTFDISTYDYIQFNVTTADGTGEVIASGFFNQVGTLGGELLATFKTIQTDAGTSPVASSTSDTLTITSSDASVTITGNATTDTIDIQATAAHSGLTDNTITKADGTTDVQSSGIIIDDTDTIIHTKEGDQFILSQDQSQFRTGAWSNTASGDVYGLNSKAVMYYQSHNAPIDANGNFLPRDEDGENSQIFTITEDGHQHYFNSTNLTGIPIFELRWGVNPVDGITGSGVYPYKILSQIPNSATAIGFEVNTQNNLNTDGSKAMSVKNAGTELFFIGHDNGKSGVWSNKVAIGADAQIDEYSGFKYKDTMVVPFSATVPKAAVDIDASLDIVGAIKSAAAFSGKATVLPNGSVLPFVSGMLFEVVNSGTQSWGASGQFGWTKVPAVIASRYTSTVGSITMGNFITNVLAAKPTFDGGKPSGIYAHFCAAPMDLSPAESVHSPCGLYVATQEGTSEGSGIRIEPCSHAGIILRGNGVGSDVVFGLTNKGNVYHDGTDLIVNPKLAGTGKLKINGELNTTEGIVRSVEIITATTDTLDGSNDIVFLDATTNAVTITLPPAATDAGRVYEIKCINSDNVVTVDGDGTETIESELTQVLTIGEAITVVSDGSNWQVI